MEPVQVGKLITDGDRRRDAIHVAIAPVVCGDDELAPGEDIAFEYGQTEVVTSLYTGDEKPIGIVDPFLSEGPKKGERFYIFLYPNTVTSLRHVWTHPAFRIQAPKEVTND